MCFGPIVFCFSMPFLSCSRQAVLLGFIALNSWPADFLSCFICFHNKVQSSLLWAFQTDFYKLFPSYFPSAAIFLWFCNQVFGYKQIRAQGWPSPSSLEPGCAMALCTAFILGASSSQREDNKFRAVSVNVAIVSNDFTLFRKLMALLW